MKGRPMPSSDAAARVTPKLLPPEMLENFLKSIEDNAPISELGLRNHILAQAAIIADMRRMLELNNAALVKLDARATAAEAALDSARREHSAELEKATKAARDQRSLLDMYANAWCRELGGALIPKSHEIDALVLTTRRLHERVLWANRIILGEQTRQMFDEAFAFARDCAWPTGRALPQPAHRAKD